MTQDSHPTDPHADELRRRLEIVFAVADQSGPPLPPSGRVELIEQVIGIRESAELVRERVRPEDEPWHPSMLDGAP